MVTSSAHSRSEPTGTPMAMRVTRTPRGFEKPGEVDGRRLAFDGGAGGEDHLLDRPRPHPFQEPLDPQLVRAHSGERRERPVQHVVAPAEVAGLLDGDDVVRLLDDADRLVAALGIRAGRADLLVRDRVAHRAHADAVEQRADRLREAARVLSRPAHQVEGDPLRRLRPDPGQLAQLVDQPGDRRGIVHGQAYKPRSRGSSARP